MSIRDSLDENDDVGQIIVSINNPLDNNKVLVFVEGDDDEKLFFMLLDGSDVDIKVSYGKGKLLETVLMELELTSSVIGIRDADFLYLEGKTEAPKNIFLTDYHDVEMMIITCDKAYQRVTVECLAKQDEALVLRENILKAIAFIGGLKWINVYNSDVEAESLGLDFDGLGLTKYYVPKTFQFKEEEYLQVVMQKSKGKKTIISATEVRDKIKNIVDFYNLCNGKDFQEIFSCHVIKGVGHKEIKRVFRMAYRFEDFQQTQLYQQLKAWSDSQSKVLFRNN